MSLRDTILNAPLRQKTVSVPEWGCSINVRENSINSRRELFRVVRENMDAVAAYHEDQALPADGQKGVAKAEPLDHGILEVIFMVVDDAGNQVFSLADHDALKE